LYFLKQLNIKGNLSSCNGLLTNGAEVSFIYDITLNRITLSQNNIAGSYKYDRQHRRITSVFPLQHNKIFLAKPCGYQKKGLILSLTV
ncbi:MAG TPA: hypothetical protein VEY10_06545, partial [Flavisolibacter sp.]|nr:hypothetical protein [Flavisolibacter sp.]